MRRRNLLTDLLYPVIDRRITARGGGPAAERPASTDQPLEVTA
ncbi:hypothetical protein ACQ3I4_09375 [Zafaria sp. Z1313]